MKKQFQAAIIMMVFALFMGACQPADIVSAQQNPTQSVDTQSQINTAVAQTIEAQNQIGTAVALTTEAQYTATPTATLAIIPSLTPFAILTPTSKPSSGGGAPAKALYSCDVIRLRPTAYAEYNRGQDFYIKMTVVNNGTRAWYEGFDIKYTGGPQMSAITRVQLPAMAPGDQHEVVLEAAAPSERGVQTMTWAVDGRLCFGYVTITVK
jgi:hypothetical protein